MVQETIFVQTDPSFDIVLRSLNELNSQGLLQVTHIQTAWIPRIESNIEGDANKHFFGPANEGCIQSFARSASSVARMCMLQATNVHQMHWPETGNISGPRNKAILNGQGHNQLQMPNNVGNFILANNAVGARRYYSKYDHLYPHFLIEDNLIPVGTNNSVFLPSIYIHIAAELSTGDQSVLETLYFALHPLPPPPECQQHQHPPPTNCPQPWLRTLYDVLHEVHVSKFAFIIVVTK